MDGHGIDLPGDRSVWLGCREDTFVLRFRRPEPEEPERVHETVVVLSRDAFEALAVLCYRALERGDTAVTEVALAPEQGKVCGWGDPAVSVDHLKLEPRAGRG